jgi:hypothetical protein
LSHAILVPPTDVVNVPFLVLLRKERTVLANGSVLFARAAEQLALTLREHTFY